MTNKQAAAKAITQANHVTDKHFCDWESEVFGFGYGTGEIPVLAALTMFMELVGEGKPLSHAYDYAVMEANLGAPVAWLLINILCHAKIIEYGVSPRYGWLTQEGRNLREYLKGKSVEQLYRIIEDYNHVELMCLSNYCNCGAVERGERCNPLWIGRYGK